MRYELTVRNHIYVALYIGEVKSHPMRMKYALGIHVIYHHAVMNNIGSTDSVRD